MCVCVTFLLCKINKTISHSLTHSLTVSTAPGRSVMSFLTPTAPMAAGHRAKKKKKYPLNCSINFEFFRLCLYPLHLGLHLAKWKWKQQNASPDSLSIALCSLRQMSSHHAPNHPPWQAWPFLEGMEGRLHSPQNASNWLVRWVHYLQRFSHFFTYQNYFKGSPKDLS